MPRETKKDALTEMESWIEVSRGLRATTARVYKYHVRAAIKAITEEKVTDEEAVAHYFDDLYFLDPVRHSNHKRSWTIYVEWMAKEKGVTVAPVMNNKSIVNRVAADMPAELVRVLIELTPHPLKLKQIPQLFWGDVESLSATAKPRIKLDDGSLAAFDRADLEVLRVWAQGDQPRVRLNQP